jgi:ComF family protein
LCNKCFLKLDNFEPFCYICNKKSKNFKIHKKCLIENKLLLWKNFNDKKIYLDRVIVMTHYKNDVIKKLITHFKFYWKKDIWKELWEKLWNFIKELKILNTLSTEGFSPLNESVVIPVPLHFFKKIKRWFNQSEILAENFSKVLNFNYKKNLLIRKKYTRQQSKLSRQERLNNLNNSFKINKNQGDKVDNKIVFLIDDVVTSWTTLNEIAKVLKQNWARKVIWICLASN